MTLTSKQLIELGQGIVANAPDDGWVVRDDSVVDVLRMRGDEWIDIDRNGRISIATLNVSRRLRRALEYTWSKLDDWLGVGSYPSEDANQ